MVNNALWIAGCARSVVKADRIPFVRWQVEMLVRGTSLQKIIVFNVSQPLPVSDMRIFDIDNNDIPVNFLKGLGDDGIISGVYHGR